MRPGPRALLDLTVEELQGHLIRRLLLDVEDEHACEHLIEDDSDGPDINLMAVTLSTTPVSLDLLRRHHQRGALEREGTVIADFAQLRTSLEFSRVTQVCDLDLETLIF